MLGFVGSSWAYVGSSWDYVGRSWVLCWAILALCWPILGLCCAILGLCRTTSKCKSCMKTCFQASFSRYLQCFLHVARFRSASLETTKRTKFGSRAGKTHFLQQLDSLQFSPKSKFYCNLQCFLHLLNTHLEPQNLQTSPEENGKRVSKGAQRNKIHPKCRWGCKNASTLLRRFHGSYSVFCTSHIPKAACNIAPKIQTLSSHAGKMVLDKHNIALQDLKIKKHPHRVNAHLPLGLDVDAKKNVLVLAHLASRIWPYSPPRSQHSPPSGPMRLHMTPDRPNIALK